MNSGWADYRLTDAHSMQRWWELVMCAYLLVSLQAPAFALQDLPAVHSETSSTPPHPAWTDDASWKHRLTNLRLLLQPFVCCLPLAPLAPRLSPPAPHRRPRRPLLPHEYLPPSLPNMTKEG